MRESAPPIDSPIDVLIVGGGVIGSAIACFLSAGAQGSTHPRIVVVEMDSTYARSSTALSVGGIRQQFSTPENIRMSLFSAEFFRRVGEELAVEDESPELGFIEAGYLFLATEAGVPVLHRNHELQRSLGSDVTLLDPGELSHRFPWLSVEGLAGGSLGLTGEGWVDPYSLLWGFRKKAQSQGVRFLTDEVVSLETDRQGRHVISATLREVGRLSVGSVVNAAGPRAARVARLAGIEDLPVEPRKRFVYRVHCRKGPGNAPLTIDPSGVYFRPEGPDFLCGVSPPTSSDPATLDLEMAYNLFHEVIWPALARRVPAFDALKLGNSWAGHYAVNTADRNAILGPHPVVENVYFASGFSGHGLQQSPAVGRALSELILFGEYRTLDLARFGFGRFESGALVPEENVV